MGTFQIVYDDFSGGQYMGPHSSNWPKNTWFGESIAPLPNGQIVATGARQAVDYSPGAGTTSAQIFDQWLIGNTVYVFAQWFTSPSTYAPKMVKAVVNNGTAFPVTPTVTSLGARMVGKVAYDPSGGQFFYVDSSGNIRKVTTAGSDSSVSTALAGQAITDLATYNYRVVGWSSSGKKLWYSGTDLATWATSQYYEFDGYILNVLPRANDLLVFCTTGVYSMVGVLGSGVTIQLIVPQANLTDGMRDATLIGRTAYFFDQSTSGLLDGRIYQLVGSRVTPAATLPMTDLRSWDDPNQVPATLQPARVQALGNSNLAVVMANGTVFATAAPGQWVRFYEPALWPSINGALPGQISVARTGENAMNDFFIVGTIGDAVGDPLWLTRYIHSPTYVVNSDQDFVYGSGTPTTAQYPCYGTVTLPEYWHQKPLNVKEILVQYYCTPDGGSIQASIEPTGALQSTGTQIVSSTSVNDYVGSTAGQPPVSQYIFSRFLPNNASKSYGIKPILSLSGYVAVKRVIIICED